MGIIECRYEVICKLNLSEEKHLHMVIHVLSTVSIVFRTWYIKQ